MMTSNMQVLYESKARALNPVFDGYRPPAEALMHATLMVDVNPEKCEAILAAHDYGLDALNGDGRQLIEQLIGQLKDQIWP